MSNPPLTAYIDYPSASGSTNGPLIDCYGVLKISKDPGTNIPATLTVSGTVTATSGLTVSGGATINNANGAGLNVSGSAGGIAVTGGATIDQMFGGVDATPQALVASGATISVSKRIERCTTTASATAAIMQTTSLTDGQTIAIVNDSANPIVFAASATSGVAGGTTITVSAQSSKAMIWVATKSLWYGAI